MNGDFQIPSRFLPAISEYIGRFANEAYITQDDDGVYLVVYYDTEIGEDDVYVKRLL